MSTPSTSRNSVAPRFSIIIPTYNEADDVGRTLDALLGLDYPEYEILVVDESTDRTPEIVQRYPSKRVRYIRQTRGAGRAAARNQGILEAEGDVALVLNADVSLPADMLARLSEHYRRGADYVLVESRVSNVEHLFARYVQAQHRYFYGEDTRVNMNWSEGFSCRRAAAIDVGLFPEGLAVPLVAGEDGWFGEKLQARGYRKVFDRSIVVSHVVPHYLRPFFRQRLGRGHGVGQLWVVREGISLRRLAGRVALQTLLALGGTLLLWPVLSYAIRLARCSPRGLADAIPFVGVALLERAANTFGLWYSVFESCRAHDSSARSALVEPT